MFGAFGLNNFFTFEGRKNSETDFDLVLIDGLGDVSYFTLPNKIPYFARKRINRRWNKFIKKYKCERIEDNDISKLNEECQLLIEESKKDQNE